MTASRPAAAAPETRGDHPVWAARGRRAEVRFVGRGPDAAADASRAAVLAAVAAGEPSPPAALAAARQVHGATVLEPPAGAVPPTGGGAIACGEGDALVTDRPGLALSVITADCVPVLVEAGGWIAAVHAGWRGLVAGVIDATVRRLAAAGAPPPGEWTTWIGPTIGACCYEVDEDVAARVAAASSPAVVSRPGPKPHLDLAAAARRQLAAHGVADVRVVPECTRCRADLLWSYRRQGARAGRNHSFIWIPRTVEMTARLRRQT